MTGHNRGRRALGVGELLWDELPDGPRIGGAPFNVTAHLARLGYDATYATAVGRDERGDEAVAALGVHGIDTSYVQRVDTETGAARVELDAEGSPTFVIATPAAHQQLRLDHADLDALVAQRPDVVVIGTLAHSAGGVLDGTARLLARLPAAVTLYDVNLRDGWWTAELVGELARHATVLKLSTDEAHVLAEPLTGRWAGAREFARRVANRFGLRAVAITDGADAASLLLDGVFVAQVPPAVDVADAVGAGDAFAAGLLDAVAHDRLAAAALAQAAALGALVASRPGAVPDWTGEELDALVRAMAPLPLSSTTTSEIPAR